MDRLKRGNLNEETSSNNSVGSSSSNKGVAVTAILSKTSDHSIQTRNGAIRNSTDLNSWLTKHDKTNELFRYHVDFHAMMEHIFYSEASMDSLELMEKCHKAGLRTVGEAITVSSYDHKIPLLLNSVDMKSSPLVETDTNASCFNAIQSPDDFDGFKQRFRQSLFEFGRNHQRMVDICFAQGSDLHRIASESLTESISFAEGLIQYMGKTYKVYSAPNGLEENHAWHLTTALAKRLVEFVGEPRLYVTSCIIVGDLADINRRITMASFRSLDKMKKIVSPEAIETLQATAQELKEDLAEMKQMSNSREAAELLHQQIQMKNQIDALVGGVATMKRFITEGSFSAEMPIVKGSKLRSQFLCIYRWQIATARRNGRSSSFDTQDLDLRGMD